MANRQIRDPGALRKFEANGRVSENVPGFAVDQSGFFNALGSVAGQLSDRLGQLADKAAQREGELAGLTAGQLSGAAYLKSQAVNNQVAAYDANGTAEERAKAILRKEEGFRDAPYWDTNAYRTGYGSDTITTADGKQARVTKGMKITRDDAERDLSHRLANVEGKAVREQLGETWGKLPDNAKAALLSVGYNYGSLPSNVVKAAKSGDLAALSGAVAGLSSNPGRRKREAAFILADGTAPAADKTTENAAAKVVEVAPALSTEPLALRRDGTIRGDAFDQSASRSFAWRMQQGISTDLATAYDQHKDDPEAYGKAVNDIRAKYQRDESLSDPLLQEAFTKEFSEKSAAYGRDVINRHEARLREDEQASFAGAFAANQVELERQTMALGASPEADKLTQTRLGRIMGDIDNAQKAGTITAAAALKLRTDAEETAVRGRIQGVYQALPTAERKQEFALSLLEDWKNGEGPLAKLPFHTVKSLSDTLRRDASSQITALKTQNKVEAARIKSLIKDDVASIETTGQGLDPTQNKLDAAHVAEVLGPEGVAKWQQDRTFSGHVFDATSGMETQTADDLAERLALIQPKPGTPGFADQEKIFALAQKKATAVLKARADDPAKAVESSFPTVKELASKANPQDPASMQNLVAARLQAQDAIGIADFAQEPLTNEEALNLSRAVTIQPDPAKQAEMMAQLADQVVTAYGPHSDGVMAQILRARGVNRELSELGAAFFKRSRAELPKAAKRQGDVATDTAAADDAGKARPTDAFALPNYKQQQLLLSRPELAADYDKKFGPGAAQQVLGRRKTPSQSYATEQGTVTVNPDGSEDFTPKAK